MPVKLKEVASAVYFKLEGQLLAANGLQTSWSKDEVRGSASRGLCVYARATNTLVSTDSCVCMCMCECVSYADV